MTASMPRVCFHVTSHGFGHASRCQAVAEQLLDIPFMAVVFRTASPAWIFDGLLGPRCTLSRPAGPTDPGVVQSDSLHHDLEATLDAWRHLLDRADELIADEASFLRASAVDVVVSDISPLPLAAAGRAGLPAVAMGNFTWDWLLAGYLDRSPAFGPVVEALRLMYRQADLFLRLPMSHPTDLFARQIPIGFTARRSTADPARTRAALGLPADELMVLLSFGGFGLADLCLDHVADEPGMRCVWDRGPARPPVLLSARDSDLRYPDLIRAADVVLTKPGYSIIAEAVAQRTPVAYVPRRGFRESTLLEPFLREQWASLELPAAALADGSWAGPVARWARGPHELPEHDRSGAAQAARAIRAMVR